jgi:hypothetical protein
VRPPIHAGFAVGWRSEKLCCRTIRVHLGGHDDVRSDTADGFANDLFRAAEPVDRRGIDHIDPAVERLADRGDRLVFIGTAPHPSADGPSAHRYSRDLQRGAGDFRELHLRFQVLYPTCPIQHASSPPRERNTSDVDVPTAVGVHLFE